MSGMTRTSRESAEDSTRGATWQLQLVACASQSAAGPEPCSEAHAPASSGA